MTQLEQQESSAQAAMDKTIADLAFDVRM